MPKALPILQFFGSLNFGKIMFKKNDVNDVVKKFGLVHGDKYDYSNVNNETFGGMGVKLPILCKKHGLFYQDAHTHLKGEGCPYCFYERKRNKLIFGVATNDSDPLIVKVDKYIRKAYHTWHNMIRRCYDVTCCEFPLYSDCCVCDEWLLFSNFYKWWQQNYVDGWDIDKDLLSYGNKIYSPQTCCFLPHEINTFITSKHRNKKDGLPKGVFKIQNGYYSSCYFNGSGNYLGYCDNINDAFQAYKTFKEKCVKELAEKWKSKLTERVYNALLNYKVK